MLSQLRIHCDNADRGCPHIEKLEMLEAHVAQCGFSPVQCSNDGCELMVNRKDQRNHEINNCNFRKGKCEVCGEEVTYGKRLLYCYVTRTDFNKMKDEMYGMKEIVTNFSRELTRHMDELKEHMVGMNKPTNDLKREMDEMKKIVHKIEEQLKGRYSPLGFHSGCLVENWNVKNDVIIAGGDGLQSVEMFSNNWRRS